MVCVSAAEHWTSFTSLCDDYLAVRNALGDARKLWVSLDRGLGFGCINIFCSTQDPCLKYCRETNETLAIYRQLPVMLLSLLNECF